LALCGSRKYPYPTIEGIGNSRGVGVGGVKHQGNSRGEGVRQSIWFPDVLRLNMESSIDLAKCSIACVASVSMRRACILAARKLEREQKLNEAGVSGAREATLACKPFYFEKPVRPRTGLLIGVAWSS